MLLYVPHETRINKAKSMYTSHYGNRVVIIISCRSITWIWHVLWTQARSSLLSPKQSPLSGGWSEGREAIICECWLYHSYICHWRQEAASPYSWPNQTLRLRWSLMYVLSPQIPLFSSSCRIWSNKLLYLLLTRAHPSHHFFLQFSF